MRPSADQCGLRKPGPKRLHHRADRVRASGSDDRLEQRRESRRRCGLTNILKTTLLNSRALLRPLGARQWGQLATATGSSPLRSPRYGSQEEEHKPFKDALQNAPSGTRWLVRRALPKRRECRLGGTELVALRKGRARRTSG